MTRIPRPAARILLVDGAGRTLMFRFTPMTARPSGARRVARSIRGEL